MRERILFVSFFILLGTFILILQPPTAFAIQPPELSLPSQIIRGPGIDEICAEPHSDSKGLNLSRVRWRSNLAELGKFKRADAATVTGVFVCKMLALDVAQQPANDPVFISDEMNAATQFHLAEHYGTIGLLAHNTRSGSKFFKLSVGQEVQIVYGDGTVRSYMISEIQHFQALDPDSPYTDFVDLDHGGTRFSSMQVFAKFYEAGDRVVFQTCIDAHGKTSWGRLFVIALPISAN